MHTIAPVVIIFGFGAGAGVLFHSRIPRFWLASLAAAFTGGILWVAATFFLFLVAAPSELGPPLPGQLAKILLTTLAGAVVAGWVIRSEKDKPADGSSPH